MRTKAQPPAAPALQVGDCFATDDCFGNQFKAVVTEQIPDESENMIVINKRTGAGRVSRVMLYSLSHIRINTSKHRTRVVPFDDYYFARIESIVRAEVKPSSKRANSRTTGKRRPAVC